ncbi:MAG: hypothetical protein [Caudoviricetes sp.]|nr:MAG: hypothetical protein [Caudoviricetes sp.]
MREIKFRAWNNQEKHYVETDDVVISIDGGPVLKTFAKEIYGWTSDIEIEQYTGLHDKNGKEIYEGDVVKLHVVILSPDDKVGFIDYSPKFGYCIKFGGKVARQEYWAANDKHTIEVIGNIHENPELLEKNK